VADVAEVAGLAVVEPADTPVVPGTKTDGEGGTVHATPTLL
jgi:hypothetical protein